MEFTVRTQEDFRRMLAEKAAEVTFKGNGWLDLVTEKTGLTFPDTTRSISFFECGTIPGIPLLPTTPLNLCFYKTDVVNKAPAPQYLGCLTVNDSAWPFAGDATSMSSLSLLNYAGNTWPTLPGNLIQLRVDRAPNLPVPAAWAGSLLYIELEDLPWNQLPNWPGGLRSLKLKGLPLQELPPLPNSVESFDIYGIALTTLPALRSHGLVSMRLTWEPSGDRPEGAIQILDVVE
jgi:hypothetical protein